MSILKMAGLLILLFLGGLVACAGQLPTATVTPTLTPSPTVAPSSTPTSPPPVVTLTATPGPTSLPATAPAEGPTPTSAAVSPPPGNPVVLFLEIASTGAVSPGSEVPVELRLDPNGHEVIGVQFEVAYNQEHLHVLDFAYGTVLGPDPMVIEKINERPGVSLYAIARRGPTAQPASAGTLATATLRLREDVAPGTPVQAALQRVKIADESFQQVVNVRVSDPLQLVVAAP